MKDLSKLNLNEIAEFLVGSENTATENTKTDWFFDNACTKTELRSLKLADWTAALLDEACDSDKKFKFARKDREVVVEMLLADKAAHSLLNSEFKSLKEEARDEF